MCNGSDGLLYEMMMDAATFTPDQVDPLVYCAECMGNTFNTGKNCFQCPDGCQGCDFMQSWMWNTVS